jgi:hypothetical protein
MAEEQHTRSRSHILARYGIRLALTVLISGLAVSLYACNMPGQATGSLEATQISMNAQATAFAQQANQLAQSTLAAADETRIAQNVQATSLVQQATQLALQATQLAQSNAVPPTATSAPTSLAPTEPPPSVAPPTELPPTSTEVPPTPTPDFPGMIKNAKILLYEDMAGTYQPRYIRDALDIAGLSYVDVGDASGNFKQQILSGTDWDLIIVGAESRSKVQGEFFVYLLDEINKGTAVIIEIWNLDDIGGGKFSSILTKCGLEFQSDWYNPKSPSLWFLAPEHPVFHEPNEGISLVNYLGYWKGDSGDLIRLSPGSEATLLAGNIATEKQRYGTLATCLDGRVIIQTFSSHDYHREDVTRLWQNYVYFTLKSHFETKP